MKKFGLIGYPIAHSLSPSLFKAAYDGKYPYDLIEEDDFEKAYSIFLKEYDAINVTAPFKELAYRMADIRSSECEAIGAANILIRQPDGKILADNSDIYGVRAALSSELLSARHTDNTALIVGCGGAAKAAAYATCCASYRTVILNRSLEKAQEFTGRLAAEPKELNVIARPLDEFERWFRKADVVIYNLPVMIPAIEKLTKTDIRGGIFRSKNKIILEANYKDPAFTTSLIENLQSVNPNIRYISGKEWLLKQAVIAYRAFTGEKPDADKMRTVIQ